MNTIEREIKEARDLYSMFGDSLKRQREFAEAIQKYEAAISETYTQMARRGITEACSACSGRQAGSCCFQGVEDWYDRVTLLVNLLMGVGIPETREVPGGCLFVGSKGCRLLARNAFCVNYLCPDLAASMGEAEKTNLLSVSGKELLCGWELEKSLRSWLTSTAIEQVNWSVSQEHSG
jgi:phage anti-repressor protein